MEWRGRTAIAVVSMVAAACGSSPTSPSSESVQRVVQGQAVIATDGAAATDVSVLVGGERATTDANGMFQVGVEGSGRDAAVFASQAIVERRTTFGVPDADRVRVSLIPSSFDLTAFDEMFRTTHSHLQRWTTRPRLIVLAAVMSYQAGVQDQYPASAEQLTEAEVTSMTSDLTEGLAILTGGTFTSFASVEVERASEGARVGVTRPGAVVVGRYNDVVTFASTIGYGQWAEQPDGTVTAGVMFLDRDFDRSDGRRRLLRIHELGHALGYRHVTARTSIMNPAIGPQPTDFDRQAAIIAFQRPPGNHAPDTDPGSGSTSPFRSVTGTGSVWARPVPCDPTY